MGDAVAEGELGGRRWLGVRGSRAEAFRALGEAAAGEIRGALESMPEIPRLRKRSSEGPGRKLFDAIMAQTRESHDEVVVELEALGAGAGADSDLLLLANLRGDLGSDDGTGCSDLGWRRERSYVAHNEDGAAALREVFMFVTVDVDGEPPVFVAWYPGFVPANSFVVTGHGLVWGIDHLTVHQPRPAPGRHFVARGLQRSTSLDEAVAYLAERPSAGGFAYTIGEFGTGRVGTVEIVGDQQAAAYADPADRPLLWHTNHLRYAASPGVGTSENSEERGCVLDALEPPEAEPDADWFLNVLAGAPLPNGVHRPYVPGDGGMTLATAVADLTADEVTLLPAGGSRQALPVDRLLAGP